MKNNTKKIIIIVVNAIAVALNLMTTMALLALKVVSQFSKQMELPNIEWPQIVVMGLCIIFSILTIGFSINIEKNKAKVGACIIVSTMLGSIYSIIASFISIIVLYWKNKEEEKIEMPKLPEINNKISARIIYLFIFILLFVFLYAGVLNMAIGSILVLLPFGLRVFLVYLFQLIYTGVPLMSNLVRDTREFFKNRKIYYQEMIKTIAIIILIYVPFAVILKLVVGETSTNQNTLAGLPKWFMMIIGIFIGPICEEMMFRGLLRKVFKNNVVFIIISSIMFGVIHCMYIETNLLMYLYIIPYAIIGLGLAKLYSKTDNIWTNIIMHMGWNTIAFVSMLMLGN